MRIISEKPLREFWTKYRDAENSLREWIKITKAADWNSFADVRNTFRSADIYQICTIFDIGGNKYRLIAKIRYRSKKVFVRFVLTHSEYDKDIWQKDCEC